MRREKASRKCGGRAHFDDQEAALQMLETSCVCHSGHLAMICGFQLTARRRRSSKVEVYETL